LNFWHKQSDFGSSLAKIFPSEESFGEEYSKRRIFLAKNSPAKNFCPNKKITVAKKSPAKTHPSEELSGEKLSGEELSGEKLSGEEFS
jgi:hypothetical protein